jgi:aryl-alcohol dehydrogenase-like predicted oxidoreductase
MQNRKLGRSGISISPLVLGGNVFGWTADEPTSFAILDRFLDAGFNAIDTADSYSAFVPGNAGGESETIIGKWLKRRAHRNDTVIMTKVGMWEQYKGLRASNIEAAAEESLRRLQTSTIDVYFAHVDDQTVRLDETLSALSRLIQAGKVKTIGASNYDAGRLGEALEVAMRNSLPRYEVLQPHYNLYDRAEFESGLEKLALDNDLGVVSYFGLASGFLTGKYRSEQDLKGKARGRFVQAYLNDRGYRILRALDQVSAELPANPAQVALAWLIARPSITAPIASVTSVKQLDETLGAARLQLSGEAVRLLDEASA